MATEETNKLRPMRSIIDEFSQALRQMTLVRQSLLTLYHNSMMGDTWQIAMTTNPCKYTFSDISVT